LTIKVFIKHDATKQNQSFDYLFKANNIYLLTG